MNRKTNRLLSLLLAAVMLLSMCAGLQSLIPQARAAEPTEPADSVNDAENPSGKLRKVTVSGIQVPVIGEALDFSYSVASGAEYEKYTTSKKIRWTKKDGSYEIACTESELVQPGQTYYANVELHSKSERPFDGSHTIEINVNTLHGSEAVYHKVVETKYKLYNDNMLIEVKIAFRACEVYDYTFELTNKDGVKHGMPRVGDKPWDYQDVYPNQYDTEQLDTLSLRWYKAGTSTVLMTNDKFQAGQQYELHIGLWDGKTTIIEPGTLIVYYDDATGLYFEGELGTDHEAVMSPKFYPIDPVLHSVTLTNFSKAVIDDTVGQHKTTVAEVSPYQPEFEITEQRWRLYTGNLGDSYVFMEGEPYYADFVLTPLNGYQFESGTTVTLKDTKGNTIALKEVNLQSNGTIIARTYDYSLIREIDTVKMYFTQPTAGRKTMWCKPSVSSQCELTKCEWYVKYGSSYFEMEDDDYFETGKEYYLSFTIEPKSGYTFPSDAELLVYNSPSMMRVEDTLIESLYTNTNKISGYTYDISSKQKIETVRITGYEQPIVDRVTRESLDDLTVETEGVELLSAYWVDSSFTRMGMSEKFHPNEKYSLYVELRAEDDYFFADMTDYHIELYDEYGIRNYVQYSGFGDIQPDFVPGTEDYMFYTKFVQSVSMIWTVDFNINEPVSGGTPDYTVELPDGAIYYIANVYDNPTWWKNDVCWSGVKVGDNFGSGAQTLKLCLSAREGYAWPADPYNDLEIYYRNRFIDRYTYSLEVKEIKGKKCLEIWLTFDGSYKNMVRFVTFGYGTTPETQFVETGNKAYKPADPVEAGWVFGGWYTDVFCTEPYNFNKAVTEDLYLYAKWTKESDISSTRGDMNGDGKLTTDDAIYLLRHILMPSSYPISQSADVNGDGKITTDDAIYLLRHVLMPSSYPLH